VKMDVKRFGELVDAIKEQAKDLQREDSYIKFLCKEYFECKNEFEDERENLLRWLMGEPCEFYHSKLNREISIMIDDDYETMYIFLVIVQLITWGKQVSDNGTAFLDSLIRRAVAEQRGDDAYVDNLADEFDDFDEDDYYDDDYYDDDDEFFDEENFPDYPYTAEEKRKYHLDDHIDYDDDDYDEEDDDEYLDEDSDYCEEKYEFADFD